MLEQGEIPLTEEVEGFTFAGGIMVIPRRSEHASMFGRVLLRNAQEKVTLALPINFGRRQQFVIEQQLRNTMKIELKHIVIRDLISEYADNQEAGVVGFGGKLNIALIPTRCKRRK